MVSPKIGIGPRTCFTCVLEKTTRLILRRKLGGLLTEVSPLTANTC